MNVFLETLRFQCGWYWGPISSEYAEKQLINEPNGSFLVRDSSDDHYIFSLTVKLSGCIRHVRIEHSQGKRHLCFYTFFMFDRNHLPQSCCFF